MADSPPFMRLIHQRLCREVVNRKNTQRTVRQRIADGPPEAVQNLLEAVSVGLQCKNSKADGPPGYRGQSVTGQNGGVGQTCLIMDVTHPPPPTKPHTTSKRLSLFLSQARGGDDKVKAFWHGSRTVREHPRTLLKIVHHVLSVF